MTTPSWWMLPWRWRAAFWSLATLDGLVVLAGLVIWVWDDLRPSPEAVGPSFAGVWLLLATLPWSVLLPEVPWFVDGTVPAWVTACAIAMTGWTLDVLVLRLILRALSSVTLGGSRESGRADQRTGRLATRRPTGLH